VRKRKALHGQHQAEQNQLEGSGKLFVIFQHGGEVYISSWMV
jgi:hypothetical protein